MTKINKCLQLFFPCIQILNSGPKSTHSGPKSTLFYSSTFLFCLSHHQYFYEQRNSCQQVEPTMISPESCSGSYQQNNKSPSCKGNNKMINISSLSLALKFPSAVTSRSGVFQFIPGQKVLFSLWKLYCKIEPLHTGPYNCAGAQQTESDVGVMVTLRMVETSEIQR